MRRKCVKKNQVSTPVKVTEIHVVSNGKRRVVQSVPAEWQKVRGRQTMHKYGLFIAVVPGWNGLNAEAIIPSGSFGQNTRASTLIVWRDRILNAADNKNRWRVTDKKQQENNYSIFYFFLFDVLKHRQLVVVFEWKE